MVFHKELFEKGFDSRIFGENMPGSIEDLRKYYHKNDFTVKYQSYKRPIENNAEAKVYEKFRHKTEDILNLREVSDEVCREFGKSVLENAPFHGSSSVYWVHRNGVLTQTDFVKGDIDMVIAHSYSPFFIL